MRFNGKGYVGFGNISYIITHTLIDKLFYEVDMDCRSIDIEGPNLQFALNLITCAVEAFSKVINIINNIHKQQVAELCFCRHIFK